MTYRVLLALSLFASLPVSSLGAQEEAPVVEPAPASLADPARRFLDTLDVRLVNVDVAATGADGRPLAGLRREDFEVLDDGRPVALTHFAPPPQDQNGARGASPLRLVIYLDDADLAPAEREALWDHLHDQTGRLFEVAGEIMLVRLSGPVTAQPASPGGAGSAEAVFAQTASQGGLAGGAALAEVAVVKPFTSSQDELRGALYRLAKASPGLGSEALREAAILTELRQARGLPRMANAGNEWTVRENAESEALATLSVVREFARGQRARTLRKIRALHDFLSALSSLEGRKAVLYLSRGIEARPGERLFRVWLEKFARTEAARGTGSVELESTTYHLTTELRDLLDQARASGVVFYTVGPFEARDLEDLSSSARDFSSTPLRSLARAELAEHEALRLLAEATAGRFFADLDAVELAVGQLFRDERARYSLGYASPHGGDGQPHTIEVRLRDPRAGRLRHPVVYLDRSSDQRLEARAKAALYLDIAENRLRVEVVLARLPAERRGVHRLRAELRIPMSKLVFLPEGGRHRAELAAFVLVQDSAGRIFSAKKLSAPIDLENESLIEAMSGFGVLETDFEMEGRDGKIALAIRDEIGDVDSALVFPIELGPASP